jgi:hypothetical protein
MQVIVYSVAPAAASGYTFHTQMTNIRETNMPTDQTDAPAYPQVTVGTEPDAFGDPNSQVIAITAERVYEEFGGQVVFRAEDAEAICRQIMDAAGRIANRKTK